MQKRKNQFVALKYPYFTTYALHELFQKYGDDLLYRGGLKVYTTVNLKMQKEASDALKAGMERARLQGLNCHQAAIVAVEPSTGFIKAMVGGTGWDSESQFNRAWQARRQPGSSFKIFVYTTALESGFTPDTIVKDTPVSYPEGRGGPGRQKFRWQVLGANPHTQGSPVFPKRCRCKTHASSDSGKGNPDCL